MKKSFNALQQSKTRLWVAVLATLLLALVSLAYQPNLAAQENKVDTSGYTQSMLAMAAEPLVPGTNSAMSNVPCAGGMAGGYACSNVDLAAVLPHANMGGSTGGNDIWGWTDSTSGVEYALVGQIEGVSFVDLSDPMNPVYIGTLPGHNGASSSWRDVKVYNDHAFIVSEAGGQGVQVFDLTELATAVPPATFSNTAHYDGVSSSHNIAINEDSGYAYAIGASGGSQSGCSGGLHMIDISTPTSPVFAGCFSADGYTHDVQCVNYSGPDADYAGAEICMAANEDTLTVVDVSDKGNPVQVDRVGYTGSGYSHQGWFTEDQAYFLLDDELDETGNGHNTRTYIWDVNDLDNISLINGWDSANTSSDHNLYILGNYAFMSNYASGTRIMDLTNVAGGTLTEAGYFDTFPAHDNAGFSGQWSNYPYFASGIIIANDRTNGLFVLDPVLAPDFALASAVPSMAVCGDGSANTDIDVLARNGYAGSVTLSASGEPAGATPAFSVNPVSAPGTSNFSVTTSGVTPGTYPLTINGVDGGLTHDIIVDLHVDNSAPVAPNLVSPADGASGQPTLPTFTWAPVPGAVAYSIEIATDMAFTNIVDSAAGIAGTSYTAGTSLAAGSTYYWRVSGDNACGVGAWSAVWSFDTGLCSSPALAIPDDDPAGISNDIVIPAGMTIDDLDISLVATHTWVGDLRFDLTHVDTATTVTIYDQPGVPASTFGCAGDDLDAVMDDEAATPVEDECGAGVPSIAGSFIPNNALSAFDGEDSSGTWRITVSDNAGGDTGTLTEWCVLASGMPTDVSLSGFDSGSTTSAWYLLLLPLFALVAILGLKRTARNEA